VWGGATDTKKRGYCGIIRITKKYQRKGAEDHVGATI